MQEKDPILRERELDGYRSIAQKIRNRLQQLENANDKDKRRWIWELLQNAIDAGFPNSVDVIIELNPNYLAFQHNGGYFAPRSVTNLVHQISSKEGSQSVGRFGTGFLTTHTLSRRVEVESFFESYGKFYPFKLKMDRTGKTEEALVLGIEATWDAYKSEIQFSLATKPDPNTVFKYLEPNLPVAQATLTDAADFIPYCFAFVWRLRHFTVKNKIQGIQVTYKRLSTVSIAPNLSILSIEKKMGTETTPTSLFCVSNGHLSLVIAIQQTNLETRILPISSNTPRIFCAYPLIGTEKFYFPFVLNSSRFIPKTERDKLYLKGDTLDARTNKNLFAEALQLYQIAITYMSAQGWKDLWHLVPNELPLADDDLDRNWYESFVQQGIRKTLLNVSVVETETNELKFIKNVYFPNHKTELLRTEIWQLASEWMPQNVPARKILNQWYEISKEWQDCTWLTLEKFAILVSQIGRLSNLTVQLKKNESECLNWLNRLVALLEKEEPTLLDKHAILPNQQGIFCLKRQLYEDRDKVETELKDILLLLGEDWRREYLHTALTYADMKGKTRSRYNLLQAINGAVDRLDKVHPISPIKTKGSGTRKALSLLASLHNTSNEFYRTEWYELVKAFDKTVVNHRKMLPTLSADAWTKADNWLLQAILADIEQCKQVTVLAQSLQLSVEQSLSLLNRLFAFLGANHKLETTMLKAIFPNQVGQFCHRVQLFEDVQLPPPLKYCLKALEKLTFPNLTQQGWEPLLLDKAITAFEKNYKLQPKNLKDLSNRLNELVRKIPKAASVHHRNLLLQLAAIGKSQDETQKTIWEFSRTLYGDAAPEKIEILQNAADWDVSVCLDWVVTRIAMDIESNQFVATLGKELFGQVKAIDWLIRVIDFLQQSPEWKYLLDEFAIVPNQNEDLCKLSTLYLDEEISPLLKAVLKLAHYEWIGELLHESIYLTLPTLRKRTVEDAAFEINHWFKQYHGSKEDSKFIEIWRNLQHFFKQMSKEYLEKHFDWIVRHQAEITLATLGDDEQRDSILQIMQRGQAKILHQLAETLDEKDLKKLAENPQAIQNFLVWQANGSPILNDTSVLAAVNQKSKVKFNSLDQLFQTLQNTEVKSYPKINFAQVPPPSSPDWAAIAKANEAAREQLYAYLGTAAAQAKGYDRSAWKQINYTIIGGVKRAGQDLKIVIKGAKTGTVYFDNEKKEQNVLKEPFAELWIYDGKGVFEITVGNMIDVWNMVGMKTYMFDFTKSV